MANLNIISPKYSFVNFNEPEIMDGCCNGDNFVCLPVINEDDLKFQFSIEAISEIIADGLFNAPNSNVQLLLFDEANNVLHNWTTDLLFFEKYRTSPTRVTYVWRNNLKGFTTLLKVNQCFQLGVKLGNEGCEGLALNSDCFTINGDSLLLNGDGGSDGLGITLKSNCFIRKLSDCYTTLLEFTNDEDYAGFNYCNVLDFTNRVRLYFYLNQPKSIEDKAVYRKSNGVVKLTRSLLTKEYQVQTEHFPEALHDNIVVALAHDKVNVIGAKYTGGISKTGEYDIEWTDEICKAPAKFKALATPYAIRNNNCEDCPPEYVPCVPIAFAIEWVPMPDAYLGIPYSYLAEITGTLIYVLSGITFPAWATPAIVVIDGKNYLQITGTPTDVSAGLNFTATITNGCGSINFTDTIAVLAEEPACIPVGYVSSLPDATVGTLYNHSSTVTGDGPYVLSAVVKPTWMTITLLGSNITYSGTPDADGTAIAVSFTLTNCDALNSVNFSDSIDVAVAESYLATDQYEGNYGVVTGLCDFYMEFTRTPEATTAANADGVTVKVTFHVVADNGCVADVFIVFLPSVSIVNQSVNMSCNAGGCAGAVITCTNVEII